MECLLNDDYEHHDSHLEYVLENILSQNVAENKTDKECKQLKQLFNTLLLNQCQCRSDHCSSCHHGKNYLFDELTQELVINPERKSDLLYECTSLCKCNIETCQNRLVQRGPRKYLEIVFSTKYKSQGVITIKNIPQGAFICEYAGELLTRTEAFERLQTNEENGEMNYVLCLKENLSKTDVDYKNNGMGLLTIIDPAKRGNIGRYLNHSCDPNCQIFSVRIDCPIPKVAIFSKRFIKAGEELCFHYNEGSRSSESTSRNKIPCLCNSFECEKYMPNLEI